ncbi:hypothetical protein C0Q70_15725 [Pomacea canaliculata]|uniref:C3HC-type domain-containing protein n=2 Tax=Pomacea canaliculata TaxID=400727 RepID=A0A2T7NVM8_POMCA|nr:hypothetical protein C0Q70_15725 [Pomacea canaliculata]
MVCARYGWENADFDMLYCKACKANLCGSLPSKSDSSAYRKACKTLVTKLLTAHEKFCPISVNPCPESYLRIDLDDHEGLHQDFLQRLNSLHQSQHFLPELDYGPLQIWGFHKHHAAKFIEEKMTERDTLTQAVALSFTGWTVRQDRDQILTCTKCQRQIGLWNYKQNSNSSMNNITRQLLPSDIDGSGDCAPSSKLRKIEMQDRLDPIGSHHLWCPWTALRRLTDNTLNTSISSLDESQSPPPAIPVSHSLSPSAGSLPSSALQPSHEEDAVVSPPNNRSPAGGDEDQHLPAWVLGVHIITPGLLSKSHRLSQEIKQGTMVEGLRCIRKVLSMWSPPTKKTSQELSE